MKIKTYDTPEQTLRATGDALLSAIRESASKPFHLALSGGSTAQSLFRLWAEEYRESIPWNNIRFYWVDERCVPPDDNESNYKHAELLLLAPLQIPREHVHRILGERDPAIEAEHYSETVKWELPGYSATPRFDCVILGIGTDGHVASIFPGESNLLTDRRVYAATCHPLTGQQRVTMTGSVILKSRTILVPVIGAEKQEIIQQITREKRACPASYILSHSRAATLFTDAKISL